MPENENNNIDLIQYAAFQPETLDKEKRTVELVWTTGARVLRYSYERGSYFYRELSLVKKHVKMDRLNNGAPLLNAHNMDNLSNQIGVVEKASLHPTEKEGRSTVRFSKRADVEPIFQDVMDGIIRNVSVGLIVNHEIPTEEKQDGYDVYLAIDWEPYELSLVPAGADAGASTRSYDINNQKTKQKGDNVSENEKQNQITEDHLKAEREKAVSDERKRVTEIKDAVRKAKLDEKIADEFIASGTGIDEVRKSVLDKLAEADKQSTSSARIESGKIDETETRRLAIVNHLEHRLNASVKLIESAFSYRGMTLLEIAKQCLKAAGESVNYGSKLELVGRALHSTSDFPYVLANVANKTLRAAFMMYPKTFEPFVSTASIPDFKQVQRTQIGSFPGLALIPEGKEYTFGTVAESKEVYALATYGRKIAFTRQAIVNDDLAAFERVARSVGVKAAILESDVVWAVVTANAAMGDGTALFHADHGNLAGSGAVISDTTLAAARKAMRLQTDISGDKLNIIPRYLVVPVALEGIATKYVSQGVIPETAANVNPYAGQYKVVTEPRLDANSSTVWYNMAAASECDMIEVGYLDGMREVFTEQVESRDIDGIEIKARFDVAAKALDHRGMYMNPGA